MLRSKSPPCATYRVHNIKTKIAPSFIRQPPFPRLRLESVVSRIRHVRSNTAFDINLGKFNLDLKWFPVECERTGARNGPHGPTNMRHQTVFESRRHTYEYTRESKIRPFVLGLTVQREKSAGGNSSAARYFFQLIKVNSIFFLVGSSSFITY